MSIEKISNYENLLDRKALLSLAAEIAMPVINTNNETAEIILVKDMPSIITAEEYETFIRDPKNQQFLQLKFLPLFSDRERILFDLKDNKDDESLKAQLIENYNNIKKIYEKCPALIALESSEKLRNMQQLKLIYNFKYYFNVPYELTKELRPNHYDNVRTIDGHNIIISSNIRPENKNTPLISNLIDTTFKQLEPAEQYAVKKIGLCINQSNDFYTTTNEQRRITFNPDWTLSQSVARIKHVVNDFFIRNNVQKHLVDTNETSTKQKDLFFQFYRTVESLANTKEAKPAKVFIEKMILYMSERENLPHQDINHWKMFQNFDVLLQTMNYKPDTVNDPWNSSTVIIPNLIQSYNDEKPLEIGDCDDFTLLMKDIFEKLGIQSEMIVLGSEAEGFHATNMAVISFDGGETYHIITACNWGIHINGKHISACKTIPAGFKNNNHGNDKKRRHKRSKFGPVTTPDATVLRANIQKTLHTTFSISANDLQCAKDINGSADNTTNRIESMQYNAGITKIINITPPGNTPLPPD